MEPVQILPSTSLESRLATESRLDAIASLLKQVAREPHTLSDGLGPSQDANELVQVRLGVASALFTALKVKHAPTASHSLRVAVASSSWAALLDLPAGQRDEIEIAALLHDIGKIGIPDRILLKPGQLSVEELHTVDVQRQMGVEILRACCSSQAILDTVLHGGDWYDGHREGQTLSGDSIPLGARMLAIVDAFDAMTTDQVYRRAMSRERAMAELFEFAGAQFDPTLVKDFCTFLSADQGRLHAIVGRRWLHELSAESVNDLWKLGSPNLESAESSVLGLFHNKLLESMHDAVIFVDDALRIVLWNRAAELLTGMSQASLRHKQWSPSLVNLRDERQKLISDEDDPVARGVQTADPMLRRFSLAARNGQRAEVDVHLIPVTGNRGAVHGAMLLLRDASSQVSMEQRLKSLHEKATRDPLTQAANRAEFDRALEAAVHSHLPKNLPCSLIVCDIDHFKRINDNFGHQAGDIVLVAFTQLLKSYCRPEDLVARYGGEEFVLLCPDCDNTTATHRADRIRVELERSPQPAINSQAITASFGVTELQQGDTPETFFRRADRALYQAKENGRNLVVQLGTGIVTEEKPAAPRGWFSWFRSPAASAPAAPGDLLLSTCLATAVPLNLASEKLKGFVSDHHAAVDVLGEHHQAIRIEGDNLPLSKRESDRMAPFVIEVRLEQSAASPQAGPTTRPRTLIHVSIRPQRARDRRQRDALERARQLLVSLKAYLVAQEIDPAHGPPPDKTTDDVQKTVAPWWGANV
jgi:diguanylate cyclase (GGDEF)-like protein/PAS domain S-box-containing protein